MESRTDSEPIYKTVTTTDGTIKTVIMFNDEHMDYYDISDIYDPDNEESGKYIPTKKTLIFKEGSLYYVESQDPITYKSVIKPIKIIYASEDSDEVVNITYGNDKYCLYQDIRTDPHKLIVDNKFVIFGNNLKEYALYRTNPEGQEECISMYFDSDGKFFSNRIPLTSLPGDYSTLKACTNCHTTTDLVEGESITLRIFNNLGNLSAELVIYVRNATWLNDLQSRENPILKLDARAAQEQGDRFYLWAKQDPKHLQIQPYLMYADGTIEDIDIDEQQCFLYGLEDFVPSYPGKTQSILLKYFLNHKESAVQQETLGMKRFLTCTKEIIVLSNENQYVVKLSIIPKWDKDYNTWRFRFFAYSDVRDAVYDVTQYCKLDERYPINVTPERFGEEQHMVVNYNLQDIFNTDKEINATQHIWITLHPNTDYVKYTFRDNNGTDKIYGADGSVVRRPILWYDADEDIYFIPSSIFKNVDAIIESFYLLANPPFNSLIETTAPIPTHMVLRDATNGQQLIGGPVPLIEYQQGFITIIGVPNLVGNTVLVEFLLDAGDGHYLILYGVPVDVVTGTYNSESKDIEFPDQLQN